MPFSRKTFQFLDAAHKNQHNPKWFEKNKDLYLEAVRTPMSELLLAIRENLQSDLPRIPIHPKSVSRPIRPKNKVTPEAGPIKNFSHFTLWEKRTSLYEYNPGIHFQVGALKDDNFIGLGLYMVSSRQMSLMRAAVTDDFETLHNMLTQTKIKKTWGTLQGDTFKRFPKGYDPDLLQNQYLWHKQFYFGRTLKRSEVLEKKFISSMIRDLKVGMPFFKWIREAVGTYTKNNYKERYTL